MTNAHRTEKNPLKPAKLWALIACGGNGTRANVGTGDDIPKQYRAIAGKPLVLHTLAAFEQVKRLAGGLVVIAPDDTTLPKLLENTQNTIFTIAHQAGNTRAVTVFNGLNALLLQDAEPTDWVLVHDAARCLITPEQIKALIDACEHDAVGGLLALPLPDTLKSEQNGRVAITLGRGDKWLAQTPQMFRLGPLLAALAAAATTQTTITDESSAIEHQGLHPKLVRGSAQNFKVTYPEDFDLAQAVLLARAKVKPLPKG